MNENENTQEYTVSGNEMLIPLDRYVESLQITVEDSEEGDADYTELLEDVNTKLDRLLTLEEEQANETVSENTVSENSLSDSINKWSSSEQLLFLVFGVLLTIFLFAYMGFFPSRR